LFKPTAKLKYSLLRPSVGSGKTHFRNQSNWRYPTNLVNLFKPNLPHATSIRFFGSTMIKRASQESLDVAKNLLSVPDSVKVSALDGKEVQLNSLWKNRKVLLVFLRHFGWVCTKTQALDLEDFKESLESAGLHIIAIGNGHLQAAKLFKDKYLSFAELYTDTSLASYNVFQLPRGVWKTLGPSSHSFTMMKDVLTGRASMGAVQGDPYQQGGMFVIDDNKIRYSYVNDHTGDHGDLNKVLEAV